MDQQGADLLRKAMAIEPANAAVRHSLGLLLVRQRNYDEARSSCAAPANSRRTIHATPMSMRSR